MNGFSPLPFFAVIFGIALSFIASELSDTIVAGMLGIFKVFESVIGWIMYLLPAGLCCLLADQIVKTGVDMMFAMGYFVAMLYIGAGVCFLLNMLMISWGTKRSIFRVFQALRRPLMIAFGTRSSFAAMPSAINAMANNLELDEETTHLVIPLGITLCRFATVMTFALTAIFFAQLYQLPLRPGNYIVILIGSILAAVASAGAPGIVTLTMLSLIFDPLGLPVEAAILLILAVDPVIDPILTVVNVHTNCSATALIACGNGSKQDNLRL